MKYVGLVFIMSRHLFSTVCREDDARRVLHEFHDGALPSHLGDHNLTLRPDQHPFRIKSDGLTGVALQQAPPVVQQQAAPGFPWQGGQEFFGRS